MFLTWLLFMSLVVVGSVGYNVGMKLGPAQANPFAFAFVMTLVVLSVQAFCCVVAKYGFKVDIGQGMTPSVLKCALLCGGSAALIDACYIMGLRYGSLTNSMLFWVVGGMVALSVVSYLFLGETMNWTKLLGLAFGIVSVLLITKASS